MRLEQYLKEYSDTQTVLTTTSEDVDRILGMVSTMNPEAEALRSAVPVPSPVIEMSEVKGLADKMNFVLMPFDALSEGSYSDENTKMKRAIKGFDIMARNAGLQTYALSPTVHFDVMKYVNYHSASFVWACF